jgi:hypothetical protein
MRLDRYLAHTLIRHGAHVPSRYAPIASTLPIAQPQDPMDSVILIVRLQHKYTIVLERSVQGVFLTRIKHPALH